MMEADLVAIGKRIQSLRKQNGYTQEQLADLMNVSVQMVSNPERGNKAIRIDNLINLSRILGISTDYILTGEEPEIDNTPQTLAAQISRLAEKEQKLIRILVAFCLYGEP